MDKLRKINLKEKGQSLVELTASITFLLILVAGIVDLGRAFFAYTALRDAAQEGAAYASVDRVYWESPMDCAEIEFRSRTTSNTQIVDLNKAVVDIFYYHLYDTNLNNPFTCGSLDPENINNDRKVTCYGSTVVVTVTYPDFPLTTPFLGSILGTQTIPIQASIEDTVLTPTCK